MERDKMTECYNCLYMRSIPGDAHIECVNPDVDMRGNKHGIQNGWFLYPLNFDPVWKLKLCNNFHDKNDQTAPRKLDKTQVFERQIIMSLITMCDAE